MILLLIFVPYEIEAGSMQIVNKNKNIFKNGVEVRSTDLFLQAESGVETQDYLLLEGGIYLQSRGLRLTSNKLRFHIPSKILYAIGEVKILRDDTITVTGNYGKFSRDLLEIEGNPTFTSPLMTVKSDLIKYFVKDSSLLFLSNINFEGSGVSGKGEKLYHSIKSNKSTISESPYIFQNSDSITGDKIEIDHKVEVLKVYKGTVINNTEEGRNTVSGDTLRIFYSKNSMDSVIVINNANGKFAKKEL
jgi:lipopolysaccharide export system protein LptA